jgi:hypothetical protein
MRAECDILDARQGGLIVDLHRLADPYAVDTPSDMDVRRMRTTVDKIDRCAKKIRARTRDIAALAAKMDLPVTTPFPFGVERYSLEPAL